MMIKPCPVCNTGSMIVRTNKHTQESFMGCSTFPKCRHTSKFVKPVKSNRNKQIQPNQNMQRFQYNDEEEEEDYFTIDDNLGPPDEFGLTNDFDFAGGD